MERGLPVAMAAALLLLPSLLQAQRARDEEGFELGAFRFRPVVEAQGIYDDRVVYDEATDDAEGDLYTELSAIIYLENRPARYDLSANAGYGYRLYRKNEGLNNDFYQADLSVESDTSSPLKLGLSASLKKALDYDAAYDSALGQEPAAILTGDPSMRYEVGADIAYKMNLTDKSSITPRYDFWYYFQEFEGATGADAEWKEHRTSLQMEYDYTEKTRLFLSGYYSLQTNDDEDGTIGAATVGAGGEVTDKTSWLAHVGVSAADYEQSGSGQGVVGRLRANWKATEKLLAYIYGGSNFQPGYNGGNARRSYRLGYGLVLRPVSRWSIAGQMLHDYQEELGNTDNSETKNFMSVKAGYGLTRRMVVDARVRYVMDEKESDQTIVALGAVYRY